jgi:hypothetical protein
MTLDELRARVVASPGAWTLFEKDAYLPFPENAYRAGQLRLAKAWEDPECLIHALRGEGLTEDEADAVAREDRIRWDALVEENDRREARDQEKDAA